MGGLARKQQVVQTLEAQLQDATVAVVADYRGLTVSELTELRRELYAEKASFTVAKNTLVRRIIQGSEQAALADYLKGPTALLLGQADQVAPVKILESYFSKNKKENEIRGGLLDGKLLSANEVSQLAKLPPLDELRGKLLGAIASPMHGLVGALSSPQRGLVNVLDQFAKRQQEAGQ